jgi:hypothetical protein
MNCFAGWGLICSEQSVFRLLNGLIDNRLRFRGRANGFTWSKENFPRREEGFTRRLEGFIRSEEGFTCGKYSFVRSGEGLLCFIRQPAGETLKTPRKKCFPKGQTQ